ncbi:MAG: type VII toxin-antitoxin system HepT family RNase toxin [Vicinamibacterales bacterium]
MIARIAKIREYLALLRRIKRLADERRFVRDPLIYGNAERYLQLAIQAVLDISHHIVADRNLALPADSKSLFDLLARQKVVSKRLAIKLTAMAGFRNILVHEYLEIDRRRVYRALTTELRDFESFVRAVTRLL